MNKLRAYFRVICAPIRPSIFRHSRQANSVLAARKFEPAARNFDNYISIFFIEKPWQALDIKMVVVYHVQMWKWIVMIFYATYFLEHVEC